MLLCGPGGQRPQAARLGAGEHSVALPQHYRPVGTTRVGCQQVGLCPHPHVMAKLGRHPRGGVPATWWGPETLPVPSPLAWRGVWPWGTRCPSPVPRPRTTSNAWGPENTTAIHLLQTFSPAFHTLPRLRTAMCGTCPALPRRCAVGNGGLLVAILGPVFSLTASARHTYVVSFLILSIIITDENTSINLTHSETPRRHCLVFSEMHFVQV